MRIYEHFRYTGREQRWIVPTGVTTAEFECWGAGGGMPSSLVFTGKVREVRGGTGPRNIYFYNNPRAQGQLGYSHANNAGYAAGTKNVNAGEVYYVYVGGNGGPGHSTIRLNSDGSFSLGFRGGNGGWNGGGDGGTGAHIYQNLYNSTSTTVHYVRSTMPPSAKLNQLWYDTANHLVKKCNTAYTTGNGTAAKWTQVTHSHPHGAGPSGGGGGGATDIRFGDNDTAHRILVAGGGGGAGGQWNKTGVAAWVLRSCPASPKPPFGDDDTSTGATGPDKTWSTAINYLVGGWGFGGLGGATGPTPTSSPTPGGGYATQGGIGGPATARHKDGTAPGFVSGSGGHGGGTVAGGTHGSGGSGVTSGSLGSGGHGANATGGYDDWCAGGGGGGGGYYGGGGGGQGFKVSGDNSEVHCRGGGGGGGSNYADPSLSTYLLAGCTRPPFGSGNSGTGANGLGGFARVTYNLPPKVQWFSIPRAYLASSAFTATFTYSPAKTGGAKIDHYLVGTGSATDTAPTSATTTVMVTDHTQTQFSHTFTSPASGVTSSYFVKVVDTDGDASGWLKQTVTGTAASISTAATITSPAAGAQFVNTATVTWTLGTQTPLVAYRLGVTGHDLVSGKAVDDPTKWRRGGSRVNLATDPGFDHSAVWSSTSNVALVGAQTTYPGVSGHSGKIAWNLADDGTAENHTTVWDNLTPGRTYRLHIEVSSGLVNDPRPVQVQVHDQDGLLAVRNVDLSATAAGTYVGVDVEFTPHTQGVYATVLPSSSTETGTAWFTADFEDNTTDGFAAANGAVLTVDTAQTNAGDYALKITGPATTGLGAQQNINTLLTNGAGDYVIEAMVYAPSAGDANAQLQVSSGSNSWVGTSTVRDAFTKIRVPFHWDGTGNVWVYLFTNTTGTQSRWYDDIKVYSVDNTTEPAYGNADSGQITYLANMLLELVTEEDQSGYRAYFDGSHLNGLTGSVSWSGSAGASASYLTGTDVTTGSVSHTGALTSGAIYLDTLTESAVLNGHDGAHATVSVNANPSLPATPTVALEVNSVEGLMNLTINAADGAATYKTVSFDIFRNGVRIVTGLVPDNTTRQAVYSDTPGHGELATYVVRAIDAAGGYADQTDGTVTLIN